MQEETKEAPKVKPADQPEPKKSKAATKKVKEPKPAPVEVEIPQEVSIRAHMGPKAPKLTHLESTEALKPIMISSSLTFLSF